MTLLSIMQIDTVKNAIISIITKDRDSIYFNLLKFVFLTYPKMKREDGGGGWGQTFKKYEAERFNR